MRKSFTLLPVVFLVIVLVIVTMISQSFIAGQSRVGIKRMYSSKAFYIANAGYEYYVKQLNGVADWSVPPAAPTKDFSGGVFVITTTNASQNQITVTSQGLVTAEGISYSRKITATLNKTVGGLAYILGKYVLYFGGSGTGVNPSTTSVMNNTTINGDVFTNSNINFSNGDTVNGNVYATGNVSGTTSGITGTKESLVPPVSDPPTINTAPYVAEIATAATYAAGNQTYHNVTLSGNYYINGDVTISGNVNITGSAKIVCTGTVSVNNNASVGNNLTVISGGEMTFGNKNIVTGTNCLFYSNTSITTGNVTYTGTQVTTGSGTSFISPGDVNLGNNNTIAGFVYSGATLTVGNLNNISGNIMANYVDTIGNNTTLTLQPGLVNVAGLPGMTGGGGAGGGTSEVTTWDETY